MPRKMNKQWHEQHVMPKNPSLDERVAWHVDHAKQCGCREIPESIRKELAARKIKVK
jgi:hypothetical protein